MNCNNKGYKQKWKYKVMKKKYKVVKNVRK